MDATPAPDAAPQAARLLRWAVASVWLATGLLVLHPDYRAVGEDYLARAGLPGWLMFACCALEVALGLRVGLGPSSRWITALQVSMVLFFTAVLGAVEPALLVDPFGMLTKNLPLLAVVLALPWLEREGFSPRSERLLRAGMAVIWVTEGIFPKVLFQTDLERQVVAGSGLVPFDAGTFLVLMGCAQALSGVLALTLRGPLRCLLLAGQCAALVALPLLVSRELPWLWTHPFGPLTKNLPILAGTLCLLLRELPFLSARWTDLTLVTFALPPERLAPRLPPGVELDLHEGRALLSFVTLDYQDVRILGLPLPGYRRYPGVNLRFYARVGERRGVVFVQELVPLRLPALVARALFREPFDFAPMRSEVVEEGARRVVTREVTRGGRVHRVRLAGGLPGQVPPADDLALVLTERAFGFGVDPFGALQTLRVEHPPWEVLPVVERELDVSFAALYGPEWALLDGLEPCSVVLARGSRSRLFAL